MTQTALNTEAASASGKQVLLDFALQLADDEFLVGHTLCELFDYSGPSLESIVAILSLAQDELGHAAVFYELAHSLGGPTEDWAIYHRPPEDFQSANIAHNRVLDWPMTVVRMALYEHADAARLDALNPTTHEKLGDLVYRVAKEERFHRQHWEAWFVRLAHLPDSRQNVVRALAEYWQQAIDVLDVPDAAELEAELGLDAGALSPPALVDRFLSGVRPLFDRADVQLPAGNPSTWLPGAHSGRRGAHDAAFNEVIGEVRAVHERYPEGRW